MNKKSLILTLSLGLALSTLSFGDWTLVNDFNEPEDIAGVTDRINQEGSNARSEIMDGRLVSYPGVALEATSNLFTGVDLGVDLRAASDLAEAPVTLYFQVIQPTVSDGLGGTRKSIIDVVWGMTHFDPDQWTTETYNSYNSMTRINFGTDGFEVRDDTKYVAQDNNVFAADTVYEIWMEIDYFFNEWVGYIKGGQWTERTQLVGFEGNLFLGFRKVPGFELDGTTPQTCDWLLVALSRGAIGAEKSVDPIYLDNVYVDTTGVNSTSPAETGGATWAGYAVDGSGNADTTPWMNWVNVTYAPWVYIYDLGKYVYLDEGVITQTGGWAYVYK